MTVLRKTKKASKIQFAATIFSKGIGVLFTIWLARILFPEDYGYLTVAVLVTGFLTIFSNFGFQSFLIQNDDPDPKISHTTFFLEMAFALVIALLIFGGSFIALHYFGNAMVSDMLRLYSLNVIVAAMGHTPLALFKKDLDFAASSKSEIAYAICSHSSRVAFALSGFGALSFPLGDITGNVLKAALIYFYSPFRPKLTMVSRQNAGSILKFGGYTSITSVAAYFANQTDKLLITTSYAVSNIGLYNFGYSQSGLFYNLVLASQVSVFQSTFAKVKNSLEEARQVVYKITRFINFLCLAVYTYAIIEAKLIIAILFTEKWLPAVFYFQIFAADFMIRTFFASVTAIQISFGMAKQAAQTKVVTSSVFVVLLLVATLFQDLKFYAIAYLLASTASSLINLYVNGRVIALDFKKYWLNFVPNILVVIVTMGAYVAIRSQVPFPSKLIGLIASVSVFGIIYVLVSSQFNRVPAMQLFRMVKEYKM